MSFKQFTSVARRALFVAPLLAPLLAIASPAAAQLGSSPSLGIAEGRCRPGETGPSFIIDVVGLKDRQGLLKVELYPANDDDFLADDNKLIAAGKVFRRVRIAVPKTGPVRMCIRAPSAGTWALSFLHDRDGDGRFNKSMNGDGVGFPGNPTSLGPFKPGLKWGRAVAHNGPTPITVRLLYRNGLFSVGPIRS